MPRIVKGETLRTTRSPLARKLADELRSDRQSGQPVIEELRFPTGLIRVSVLWDQWQGIGLNERSNAILGAYQIAEPPDIAEKVRLASGITFPEAVNSGLLPYQILLAHRPGDPVAVEDCRRAMLEEGASLLVDPTNPPLLFGTEEQAEAARDRLIQRLPGSDFVWIVNRLIGNSLDLSWSDEA